MAKHKKHASGDLVDALEHVIYEMWKYKQSVAYYREISQAGGDAAIEFRVLHHRVLLEFFHGWPKHEDNICAWEYIDDWQHDPNVTKPSWFEEYMLRCHTMLAHISTTRSDMAKRGLKSWEDDWRVVEPHLDRTISSFLHRLSAVHKNRCRVWIHRWVKGRHRGNNVLMSLGRDVT